MNNPWFSAVVLAAILGLWMGAGIHRQAPLVGTEKLGPEENALEEQVGLQQDDPSLLAHLVRRYVERGASGLAMAALRRAPAGVRESPEVMHVWSSALLRQGRASDALAKERETIARCASVPCSPSLMAAATRGEYVLSAMVSNGIEDSLVDPSRTDIAYAATSPRIIAIRAPTSL